VPADPGTKNLTTSTSIIPTFLYQVRSDILAEPSGVQAMLDNISVAEKKLQWIEGTTARWTATWSSSAARSSQLSPTREQAPVLTAAKL
jgi:hypothetical protein